ncbi:DUF1648 domain-containing protein [Chloroflexota bacterium]
MTKESIKAKGLFFRWNYILLPVIILFLSVFLSIYFYRLLPAEVAYHFRLDGTPDRWFGRGIAMVWTLLPQLLLTLLAGATMWIITKLGIFSRYTQSTWIKPEKVLLFMGNMIALPQFVLFFAMLDIFSYNSYQVHTMPMWVFLSVILGLATIALMLLLAFIFSRARRQYVSKPED